MTFEDMVAKLEGKENFAWSRWGDGEWDCLLGHEGQNCDGHIYFDSLGKRLKEVLLRNSDYPKGMQPKTQRDMPLEVGQFLKHHDLDICWGDADILHDASADGRLELLMEALRQRSCVLVGHPRLYNIARKEKWDVVSTPKNNCWLAYEHIKHEVLKCCTQNKVVLLCCSMMSEVLIEDLFLMYGDWITVIDAGSVLDPYCGANTRQYMKNLWGNNEA